MHPVDKAVEAIQNEIELVKGVGKVETALEELKATLPSDLERFIGLLKSFSVPFELKDGRLTIVATLGVRFTASYQIWLFDGAGKYLGCGVAD